MSNEDAKTQLSSHMQSFSSVVLHELLEGRTNGHGPPKIDPKCKSELIKLSSSALENESWALKSEYSIAAHPLEVNNFSINITTSYRFKWTTIVGSHQRLAVPLYGRL